MTPLPDRPLLRPRRPGLFGVVAAPVLFAATAFAAEPEAPRPPAPTPSIWTTVPTRVDPAKETRERIAPAASAIPDPAVRVTGVRAADAVTLMIDGRRHRLAGLAAADPRRLCTAADGTRWACGRRAHAALSALVTGRALRCVFIGDPAATDPVVDCRLDERTLSERMVAEGWAEPDADGPAGPALTAAFAEARRAGRGFWSVNGPP
ncbi:MAG: thermonuclease family protein [Siculibacillus sp.]|nr:thermonuclease family protein [Siculibacillus sp.]